jgi:hypothetical protein
MKIKLTSLLALDVLIMAATLCGCASLTVTKVDDHSPVAGIRYYLPKPFLQVTPRADGTVSLDVIYLPDKDHEYAIDPSSTFSAYTFQVSRDEKGLLTAIEYKASTSIVGQQLATSAGAAAAQAYTIDSGQLAAVQGQVNTAQTALDAANSKYASAAAGLASDLKMSPTNTTALIADSNAVAQASAALPFAQDALARAKSSAQAVSASISATSPVAAAGPTMGTIFGPQTWNPFVSYNLPTGFAPVLFAINDRMEGPNEKITLDPVESAMADSLEPAPDEKEEDVDMNAQRKFESTGTLHPTFGPDNQVFRQGETNATFVFGQPPTTLTQVQVRQHGGPSFHPPFTTNANDLVLTFNFSKLPVGNFGLHVAYLYQLPSYTNFFQGANDITFTIKP